MQLIHITDPHDSRIAPYSDIKERTLRGENMFIAEGELVVQRLAESHYKIQSVFVDESRLSVWESIAAQFCRENVLVYVSSTSDMRSIVGYDFHLGMMAAGVREEETDIDLLLNPSFSRLVCLPACVKPDNLGSVFRSSAALGVDGILLGVQSCDPLGRRSLRTSMAATLKIPWVRRTDVLVPLAHLQKQGYQLVGTVLRDDAENLNQFVWPEKTVLLMGNEYSGLDENLIQICDHLITIPMSNNVDSLNLGVSTGIFLYSFLRNGLK